MEVGSAGGIGCSSSAVEEEEDEDTGSEFWASDPNKLEPWMWIDLITQLTEGHGDETEPGPIRAFPNLENLAE